MYLKRQLIEKWLKSPHCGRLTPGDNVNHPVVDHKNLNLILKITYPYDHLHGHLIEWCPIKS